MNDPYKIVLYPVATEKSHALARQRIYTFAVDRRAGRHEIKKAVEDLFQVRVARVNTMQVMGKPRRVRFRAGYRPSWKKALVKLAAESKPINWF